MILSEKKQKALYAAIHNVILNARVDYCKASKPTDIDVDQLLFYLTEQIWKGVKEAINLQPSFKQKDKP